MNDSTSEIDYSATAWGEAHHYSLANGSLGYRFGGSNAAFSIELMRSGFTLRHRWQTHRYFRVGLVLLAFPIFALGVIYAKQHALAGLGAMLYVHLGMLVAGLVLLVRFRFIYRAHLLRTRDGDEILIYRDPNNAERADEFISRLNQVA